MIVNNESEKISKERKWPNFGNYRGIFPGRITQTTESLSQNFRSPDQYLKPGPHKHESGEPVP
jgi:hypothetical protein